MCCCVPIRLAHSDPSLLPVLGCAQLGSYDPIASKDGIKEVRVKGDRVKYWLSVGAQPSDRVAWLMAKYNLLPPAPLPPSTVQHLPRKERKELAEAAAKAGGGAKAYHTHAHAHTHTSAREGETGQLAAAGGLDSTAAFLTGGAMMLAGAGGARGSLGVSLPWARR